MASDINTVGFYSVGKHGDSCPRCGRSIGGLLAHACGPAGFASTSYPASARFDVGDRVEKHGGDYTLIGHVVAVFAKRSGVVRYVVEDERGILMIYSEKNLRPAPGSPA